MERIVIRGNKHMHFAIGTIEALVLVGQVMANHHPNDTKKTMLMSVE